MSFEPQQIEVYVRITQGPNTTEVRSVHGEWNTWKDLTHTFVRALAGQGYIGVSEAFEESGVTQ